MYIAYFTKTKHAWIHGQDHLITDFENVQIFFNDYGVVDLNEVGKARTDSSSLKFSGIVPVIIND